MRFSFPPLLRLLVATLTICSVPAIAQPPTLDVSGTGVGSTGAVKFNDPANIGRTRPADVNYGDIRGKYMWNDDWHPGVLVMKNGAHYKLDKMKINLHTQEVHYLGPDGAELVPASGALKDVILYGADTSEVLATFRVLKAPDSKKPELLEELNPGKVRLVKRELVKVKKLPYDPSVGATEYRFFTDSNYFIYDGTQLKPLHGLNKASVTESVTLDAAAEDWLSAHKNKLKSEHDIAEFLGYYSAR